MRGIQETGEPGRSGREEVQVVRGPTNEVKAYTKLVVAATSIPRHLPFGKRRGLRGPGRERREPLDLGPKNISGVRPHYAILCGETFVSIMLVHQRRDRSIASSNRIASQVCGTS